MFEQVALISATPELIRDISKRLRDEDVEELKEARVSDFVSGVSALLKQQEQIVMVGTLDNVPTVIYGCNIATGYIWLLATDNILKAPFILCKKARQNIKQWQSIRLKKYNSNKLWTIAYKHNSEHIKWLEKFLRFKPVHNFTTNFTQYEYGGNIQ